VRAGGGGGAEGEVLTVIARLLTCLLSIAHLLLLIHLLLLHLRKHIRSS